MEAQTVVADCPAEGGVGHNQWHARLNEGRGELPTLDKLFTY